MKNFGFLKNRDLNRRKPVQLPEKRQLRKKKKIKQKKCNQPFQYCLYFLEIHVKHYLVDYDAYYYNQADSVDLNVLC